MTDIHVTRTHLDVHHIVLFQPRHLPFNDAMRRLPLLVASLRGVSRVVEVFAWAGRGLDEAREREFWVCRIYWLWCASMESSR